MSIGNYFTNKDENISQIFTGIIASIIAALVCFIWVYVFWEPMQRGWLKINYFDVFVAAIVIIFCAILDVLVLVGSRFSICAASSYAVSALVFILSLTLGPDDLLQSGMIALYVVASFAVMRFAAQFYETKSWHWGAQERRRTGLAVTSVLIRSQDANARNFVLVKNEDLNEGKGLWVSPGGRWNPSISAPEERLIEKIAEEVNYKAEILKANPSDLLMPPLRDLDNKDCRWFRVPHMLLYENLGTMREEFPQHHLDLIYVCLTTGDAAGKVPRYGPNTQVFVPVTGCEPSFEEASNTVSRAVGDWYVANTGHRPGKRDDVSHDVIWRLHLVFLHRGGDGLMLAT